jgi:hypothetical protein
MQQSIGAEVFELILEFSGPTFNFESDQCRHRVTFAQDVKSKRTMS